MTRDLAEIKADYGMRLLQIGEQYDKAIAAAVKLHDSQTAFMKKEKEKLLLEVRLVEASLSKDIKALSLRIDKHYRDRKQPADDELAKSREAAESVYVGDSREAKAELKGDGAGVKSDAPNQVKRS